MYTSSAVFRFDGVLGHTPKVEVVLIYMAPKATFP
jgi:hypothetical protein